MVSFSKVTVSTTSLVFDATTSVYGSEAHLFFILFQVIISFYFKFFFISSYFPAFSFSSFYFLFQVFFLFQVISLFFYFQVFIFYFKFFFISSYLPVRFFQEVLQCTQSLRVTTVNMRKHEHIYVIQ